MRPDYCPIGNQPCQSLCDKPCFTTPKSEWVGLTDEERENLGLAYMQTGQTAHSFVLSIEAGLKVKNT